MDQSKSSEQVKQPTKIALPKRSFSLEFIVGLFTLCGLAAVGYLSIGLGDLQLFDSDRYIIHAEFDNISGLKDGASVEIAGVPVGEVMDISLKDPMAKVTLKLNNTVKIFDDDTASIRTKGIIGDRYVKLSRGSSEKTIEPGGTLIQTESVVDIEDIIGKIVHNFSGDKDDEEK